MKTEILTLCTFCFLLGFFLTSIIAITAMKTEVTDEPAILLPQYEIANATAAPLMTPNIWVPIEMLDDPIEIIEPYVTIGKISFEPSPVLKFNYIDWMTNDLVECIVSSATTFNFVGPATIHIHAPGITVIDHTKD